MTKEQFKTYSPLRNGVRSLDEAISEIQREMDVRRRLFDRWVLEGRMSWVDAHDRLERHCSALKFLITFSKQIDAENQTIFNPASPDSPLLTGESLDTADEAVAA